MLRWKREKQEKLDAGERSLHRQRETKTQKQKNK